MEELCQDTFSIHECIKYNKDGNIIATMKHLAIFKGKGGEDILTGKKTVESRFSKSKIAPFGVINRGDLVYIKPSGGDIIGQFRVKKVIFFDGVTPEDLLDIKKRYGSDLAIDERSWSDKTKALYLTLIFIGQSARFITYPIKIPKKDLRGWVVLD